MFGFSYKKNTSDTRTSPVALFIFTLAKRGFNVAVHDPQVTQAGFDQEMREQALISDKENEMGKIDFVGADANMAVEGAAAIAVTTEWDEFKEYDYAKLRT